MGTVQYLMKVVAHGFVVNTPWILQQLFVKPGGLVRHPTMARHRRRSSHASGRRVERRAAGGSTQFVCEQ
jgi:hypothetical protein